MLFYVRRICIFSNPPLAIIKRKDIDKWLKEEEEKELKFPELCIKYKMIFKGRRDVYVTEEFLRNRKDDERVREKLYNLKMD